MKNVSDSPKIFKPNKYYIAYYKSLLSISNNPFSLYYITKDKKVRCRAKEEPEFHCASWTSSGELERHFMYMRNNNGLTGKTILEFNTKEEMQSELDRLFFIAELVN